MSRFKPGDRVMVISTPDGNDDVYGVEGVVVTDYGGSHRVGVNFPRRYHGTHDLAGLIDTATGWNCNEDDLELVSSMDSSKKRLMEEIGDYLIATKAPLSTLTTSTEYRSSMVSGTGSIKPSMTVRLGRPLTVQGKRIY